MRRYLPTQRELDAAWRKHIAKHPDAPIPETHRRRLFNGPPTHAK